MAETVAEWLIDIFKNEYLVIFLIALIPMIEVKGAIPIGIGFGLSPWVVWPVACASALIACPVILLILRPVINALKKTKIGAKLGHTLESMFRSKAEKSDRKAENAKKLSKKRQLLKNLALFAFVALPLPLTGVWTGSAIAAFSKQKYRYSVIPIVLGCIVQGLLFVGIYFAFGESALINDILLYITLAFLAISLTAFAVKLVMHYKRSKKQAAGKESISDDSIETQSFDDNERAAVLSVDEEPHTVEIVKSNVTKPNVSKSTKSVTASPAKKVGDKKD